MRSLTPIGAVVVAAIVGSALAGAGSARHAVDGVWTLVPVGDVFVSAAAPRADTRSARVLIVSPSPVRRTYLTFAQPVEPDAIVSATLELHVRRGGAGLTVALARTPWRGGRLTFAGAPKSLRSHLRQRRVGSGSQVSLNVTSLVRASGFVTLVLSSASSRVELWSAQARAALVPKLKVVARPAVVPPSPTPEPTAGPSSPTPEPTAPASVPPTADATPPSTPAGVRAASDQTSVTLTWNAASDNVGVTSYRAALSDGSASATTSHLSHTFRGLACGSASTATVSARDAAGNDSAPASLAVATAACPRIAVAGDIADDGSGAEITASLLDRLQPTEILTTGDNAYPDGKLAEFLSYYEPTWGRHKAKTHPTPGNHEYHDPGAAGYYEYFGDAAGEPGRGYYSFDVGSWHLVALNSEIAHDESSAQLAWLRADLAGSDASCVLAYWHRPRFTNSERYTDGVSYAPFWQALYDARADLVLNGHDHNYQRFRPLDPAGVSDEELGLREFVIGTGGRKNFYALREDTRREAGVSGIHGVVEFTLRKDSYSWQFVGKPGSTFTDSGSDDCH